jgi:hypothetical protein
MLGSLNRRVALKVLSSGLALTEKAVTRFRREAEAAAKLHHTNIVPIYATGEDRGSCYYAMELIEGPSLDQVIRQLRAGRAPDGLGNLEASESEAKAELPAWVSETLPFDFLARGDRDGAREHFEAARKTGPFSSYVQTWSKLFLQRMHEDRNWLPCPARRAGQRSPIKERGT